MLKPLPVVCQGDDGGRLCIAWLGFSRLQWWELRFRDHDWRCDADPGSPCRDKSLLTQSHIRNAPPIVPTHLPFTASPVAAPPSPHPSAHDKHSSASHAARHQECPPEQDDTKV